MSGIDLFSLLSKIFLVLGIFLALTALYLFFRLNIFQIIRWMMYERGWHPRMKSAKGRDTSDSLSASSEHPVTASGVSDPVSDAQGAVPPDIPETSRLAAHAPLSKGVRETDLLQADAPTPLLASDPSTGHASGSGWSIVRRIHVAADRKEDSHA